MSLCDGCSRRPPAGPSSSHSLPAPQLSQQTSASAPSGSAAASSSPQVQALGSVVDELKNRYAASESCLETMKTRMVSLITNQASFFFFYVGGIIDF